MAKVSNEERLFQIAVKAVKTRWSYGYGMLGDELKRGLLGEELLYMLAAQDEAISAENTRTLVNYFWPRLREYVETGV
jgi:hypothetical protein